jgi:hypothetical protein
MGFRIAWGFDVIVALAIVYFFFVGLADGSVSAFNAGIWSVLLLVVAVSMGGSLWLRRAGHDRLAWLLLAVLGLPGLAYTLFLLLLLITQPRWN